MAQVLVKARRLDDDPNDYVLVEELGDEVQHPADPGPSESAVPAHVVSDVKTSGTSSSLGS